MKRPEIAVIDYGMGNLRSVAKALELAGAKANVTSLPGDVARAQAVVFPGVGSFGPAVRNIERIGLKESLNEAIRMGKPFLGICLGFQLLFDSSEENRSSRGLGVIPGRVVKFGRSTKGSAGRALKVPHMGWNRVTVNRKNSAMFAGIADRSFFYFVHSYYGYPQEKNAVAGSTEYGVRFCSAVAAGNVWGCQFHPEKSGDTGLKLLKNFVKESARR